MKKQAKGPKQIDEQEVEHNCRCDFDKGLNLTQRVTNETLNLVYTGDLPILSFAAH